MGTPTGEERKIKAAEWLDETFDAAPVGVDLNDDDTLAPPARHGGEAKKRREKKEKRVGTGGVSFASDVAGAGEESGSDGGDKGIEGFDSMTNENGKDVPQTTWTAWLIVVLGTVLQILVDVAIMFTPSIKSRQRRYGISDDTRRRKAAYANAAQMRGEKAVAQQRRPGGAGPSGNVNDTFDGETRDVRRGTAGARQRALDRQDVPVELRGKISAKQWKRELRNFHEEQVAAQNLSNKVTGNSGESREQTRRKAREKATESVARRTIR